MKKGTIIGVAEIHATSEIDILRHQNKELSCHVRRLKRKLKKQSSTLSGFKTKENKEDAYLSAVQRYWAELENSLKHVSESFHGGSSSQASSTDSGEPPQKKPRIQTEVATSLLPLLMQNHSSWLDKDPIAKPEEDEDEEEEEEGPSCKLADLDQALKSRVKFTVDAISAVLRTIKEGVPNGTVPLSKSIQVELRDAQSHAEAYLHRCIHLQKQIVKLRNEIEDARVQRDVAIRRLNGWKSLPQVEKKGGGTGNGAAVNGQVGEEKVKSEPGESIGSEEALQLKQRADELETLSSTRLKELEKAKTEQQKLLEELEKLKHKHMTVKAEGELPSKPKPDEALAGPQLESAELERLKLKLNQLRHENQEAEERVNRYRVKLEQLEAGVEERFRKEKRELLLCTADLNEQVLKQSMKLKKARAEKFDADEANSRLRNLEKLLAASDEEKALLKQENQRLKRATSSALPAEALQARVEEIIKREAGASVPDAVKEVASLKAQLEQRTLELQEANETSEAYLSELDSMSQKALDEKQQLQKALKRLTEKGAQNSKLMKNHLDLSEKIRKLQFNAKMMDGQLINEQQARTPLEEQNKALQQKLELARKKAERAERMAEEAEDATTEFRVQIKQQAGQLGQQEEEFARLKQKLDRFETHNIQLQKDRSDAVYDSNRLREELLSCKKKIEKFKAKQRSAVIQSHSDGPRSDLELKAEAMERHLRCPVNQQMWKDTILMSCCHMFSRKALMDNLAKRNRKCPTCKNNYSKDHIRDIVPFQENDLED